MSYFILHGNSANFVSKYLQFFVRENTCTWGHVTWFGTLLWLRLITMEGGGVACARRGDLDTCCLVFLSVNVTWTRSGYFLMNGSILHLRVEVRCMHRTEHDWSELWKVDDYLLSVHWTDGLLRMICWIEWPQNN